MTKGLMARGRSNERKSGKQGRSHSKFREALVGRKLLAKDECSFCFKRGIRKRIVQNYKQ